MRRFRIALGALGLVLVVLAIAAWLLLPRYAPLVSRERVAQSLGRALGRPVSVERVEINPWLLRAHLYGLTAEARQAGAPPFLQVGHGRVSLAISSLWRGQVTLSALLEDVALRLTPEPGAPASAAPPAIPPRIHVGPLTVAVAEVRIVRGRIVYAPPSAQRVEIEGLRGRARPEEAGLRVQAHADAVRVQTGTFEETFRAVEVEGKLQADQLTVGNLTAAWEGQRIKIRGEILELHTPPKLRFTVEAEMDLGRLARRAGLDIAVQGKAAVAAQVRGEIGSPEVEGTISAPTLTVGPVTGRQAFLRGRWENGRLTLSEVRAQVWDGTLRGSGVLVPARWTDSHATLRVQDVSLQAFPPAWGVPRDLRGRVSGTAQVSGDPRRVETLRGSVDLTAPGVVLPGGAQKLGAGTAALAGTFAGRAAQLTRAEARWPGVDLQARGTLSPEGPRSVSLVVEAALPRLGALWARPDLTGQATLRADVRGTWRRPEATGRLSVPRLGLAGATLDRVQASLRYGDETLRVTSAEATLGRSRLLAEGTLSGPSDWKGFSQGLPPAIRFQADLRAPALRLADLGASIPPRFQASGTLSLAASVAGSPAAWQARGQVQAPRLEAPAELPVRDASGTFTLDAKGLEVLALSATVAGVPVSGTGSYAWAGTGRTDITLGPARLAGLPRVPAGLGLEGTGRGEVHVAIRPGAVSGTGGLVLANVSTRGYSLGDGTGQVTVAGDRLQATLAFPAAGIRVQVEGPLDPKASLTGSVVLRDVAVQPILQAALDRQTVDVFGTVSAEASLTIPLDAPSAARARVMLDPVALTIAGDAWRNREPVVLAWDGAALHVERLRLESRLGSFSARGQIRPSGQVDLAVEGRVPLAILPALRPEVRDAGGSLSLQGSIQGTASSPRIRGEGVLEDASLRLRDYPDVFREVNARFVVSQAGLRVERATGRLGPGRFEASGTAVLEGRRLGNYRFRLTGRELPLSPVDGLRTSWDADLELVGSSSRALLQGEARLQRGSYTHELSLLTLLLAPKPGTAAGAEFQLHLKLALAFPNALVVRTELARMQVGGRVRVEGTLDSPVVFGTLEAREGQIVFRKQEFDVVRATARFSDPRRIDPILDVEARADIRQYEVTLHLTGRSQDLNVRFTSSPPLPQEDLLSLVVFGVTRQEFGQAAAGIVAGEAAHLLVQELLGVEPGAGVAGFDVDIQRTGPGAGVLRVERDLTRRARVIFSQQLSGEGEQRLRVEYKVVGPLLIAGEQDFRGNYGADLIFRMRFR